MSLSINERPCSSLHFAGILGTGMSALAQYLRRQSLDISGSDRLIGAQSTARVQGALERMGCRLGPQDGLLVDERTDGLVVSTAIEESNPEIVRARKLGIPVFHRSDVLAAIIASKKTIAVAGTSGKSTVAAMLFHCLRACGRDPSVITGANLHALANQGCVGNAWAGGSDLLVVEADESDGSLVKYHPYLSVFLNVSLDHKSIAEIVELFGTLAKQSAVPLVNADDPELRGLGGRTFGYDHEAVYRAGRLASGREWSEVEVEGTCYRVPYPGMYMAWNLLATVAVCRELGCAPERLQKATASYAGIQRRFDRIPTAAGITVIDDFAHNPEKIRAAVRTAQQLSDRVVMLFQPHGFGPTSFMRQGLVEAFREILRPADSLYLLPIYYAGGTADKSISSGDLASDMGKLSGRVIVPDRREEVPALVAAEVKPGDVVISMGARDPSLPDLARQVAGEIDR